MMRPNKAAAADGRPGGGLGCGDDGGGSLVGAAGRPVGGLGGGAVAAVATVEVVFSSSPHIWLSYSDVSLYSILFALHNS